MKLNTRALTGWLAATLLALPSTAQDAEKATHADAASRPMIAFEAKGDGWLVRQYQLGCLSLLSYLVVIGDDAAVIDPQRDVEHYRDDAKVLGAHIRHVLLTHLHADFVAGHTELAATDGAEVAVSKLANAEFAHRGLADGDRVAVGNAEIEAWLTPGHTPSAMTFLLHLPAAAKQPVFAFTGDTLFVGSIGRPDLLDVPPADLAKKSFASLNRLTALPEDTVVLPAHGAGSLCGAHLSPETTTTIGREKKTNPYLGIRSEATFVAKAISHQPTAPQYFAFNVEMNRKGPPLVARAEELPPALDRAALAALLAKEAWIVDLRDQHDYAAGHVEGAVNVALRGRLDTWTGIVVPFDHPVVLVGDDEAVREGVFRLRRIGYDHIAGRLPDDEGVWRDAGLAVRQSKLVAPRDLFARIQAHTEPIVIDVRTADEYADLRLGDVGNIPVTDSARFAKLLTKDQPVLMVCNSAYRSSMAVGLAERLGFRDVASLDGGLDAWLDAGLPVVGAQTTKAATETAAPAAGAIALPEPIDASMLAKVLLEQPQAYAVLDIRPAWQFDEWHVPGATNVALAALEQHVADVPATRRIVLVDRDGSLAFAAAGALMARTQRDLRALLGGTQRYYAQNVLGGGDAPAAMPAPAAEVPAAAPNAPTTTPKKKRSAGC
ncbi:MAG: rhodanese-like domain-containing protein [Planctomycetota bacterium]